MNRLSDALTSFLKYPYVFRVTAVALSCSFLVPVADAQEAAPVVIDPQTQQQVELTRAYWNANVDIANRPIVCNHLAYNPDTDAYDRNIGTSTRTSSGFYRSGNGETIIHEPLVRASNGNASRGIIHHSYIPELEPTRATWTVENGVYIGNAFDAQEYLELVNYDPATTEITIGASNNAVRVWTQGQVRQGNSIYTVTNYSICYALDTDGDGFGWNGVETCIPGGDEHRPNPDPSQACIDTDGDGYGWNGVETCTPDEGESPADPSLVCEDSDDDGFGWTGTQSCRFDEQGNIVIL